MNNQLEDEEVDNAEKCQMIFVNGGGGKTSTKVVHVVKNFLFHHWLSTEKPAPQPHQVKGLRFRFTNCLEYKDIRITPIVSKEKREKNNMNSGFAALSYLTILHKFLNGDESSVKCIKSMDDQQLTALTVNVDDEKEKMMAELLRK